MLETSSAVFSFRPVGRRLPASSAIMAKLRPTTILEKDLLWVLKKSHKLSYSATRTH